MQTEVEAKFLDVNHDELRAKLEELGATCKHPVRMMRRRNFDYPDSQLEKIGGWIRVRDEGDKTTLAYKQLNDRSLHGTKEISVTVSDFAKTCAFLEAIGLEQKSYHETRRESWELDGAQIELDEWPWIKPFMEIEADNEARLKEVAARLGLNWDLALHGSVENAYQAEYEVTETEVDGWPEIRFEPVPVWLTAKRK